MKCSFPFLTVNGVKLHLENVLSEKETAVKGRKNDFNPISKLGWRIKVGIQVDLMGIISITHKKRCKMLRTGLQRLVH